MACQRSRASPNNLLRSPRQGERWRGYCKATAAAWLAMRWLLTLVVAVGGGKFGLRLYAARRAAALLAAAS
jgi:hypothetical protein